MSSTVETAIEPQSHCITSLFFLGKEKPNERNIKVFAIAKANRQAKNFIIIFFFTHSLCFSLPLSSFFSLSLATRVRFSILWSCLPLCIVFLCISISQVISRRRIWKCFAPFFCILFWSRVSLLYAVFNCVWRKPNPRVEISIMWKIIFPFPSFWAHSRRVLRPSIPRSWVWVVRSAWWCQQQNASPFNVSRFFFSITQSFAEFSFFCSYSIPLCGAILSLGWKTSQLLMWWWSVGVRYCAANENWGRKRFLLNLKQ